MSSNGKATTENVLQLDSLLSMGYGIIPKKAMRDARLTPEAKAIYAYLCSFAGSGNTAFPSVDLMCSEIGMSEDRFYRHRKLLVQCGYIAFKQIRGGRGKTGSNVYTILQSQEEIRDPQNAVPQNKGPQYRDPYNKGPQNEGTINNSSTNNSLKKNSSKEEQEREGAKAPEKRKRFSPPTVEEIEEYCREKGYVSNPRQIWNYYENNGWHVGRYKMKDWRKAVDNWEIRERGSAQQSRQTVPESKQKVVIRDDDGQKWGLFDD